MSSIPNLALRLFSLAPLSLAHVVGRLLGWAIYGLSPTWRRHLRENLEGAGYRDPATRRSAIANAGMLLAELPAVWLRPRHEALKLVRRLHGYEHVEAARAAGRAIVFLTPHFGCFEITPHVAAERMPITVMYKPPKLGWLQPLLEAGRGGKVRLARADYSGVRELIGALKRGEAIGLLPDQVPGGGEGEWSEFFGRRAYTMTLAGKLCLRENTTCVLAWGERLPGGAGFDVHLRPMPEAQPGESPARHVNRALEELIRERPEQYLWGYNRYKTPAGAK